MKNIEETKVKKLMTYRWIVWGILAFAYIIVFFHRLAPGVVKEDLVNEFSISGTTFANLGSMYFYAYMIMQIPAGILADSLGARKTVSIGVIASGIGSIIFGLAPSIFWAFIGRLLVGIGVSVVFIPILKIQSQWFKESEFGTMSGITSFAGNLGGIIAQTPLALLVAGITWRYSFVVMGGFSIIIGILCYLLVRNNPTEMNLPSIAQIEGKQEFENNNKKVNLKEGFIKVISNPRTWPGFMIFAGFFGAFVSLTGAWGASYIVDVYKISKVSAANYMISPVLGLAIGSIAIGKISDKIKKRKLPMIVFGSIYVITWGIIAFAGKIPSPILMFLLFTLGFTCSAFVLGWACSKEINPPEIAGISTSVVNIGGFFGAAIVPPLLGKVFDKFGGTLSSIELYHKAFLYCFISAIIGFVFTFFIKETNCKNIYVNKKDDKRAV
ncbi:MFS transporter [Tepidibacter formicigenes]|jgi:sugar phosphate permease|uniref:Sugar phosphate permease n=1 Tax=Tepidibacter formicigenes DSM 15518 TaxID=1123349 RepID=A0A1M6JSC0_9FIRM|nr:MFS transporter [Tepidibacter formicigenes]SHJ49536.1 Sugar phosphate permease [Tepidibacter formicigenes DSM 15518]